MQALPAAAEHVWDWFIALDRERPVGFGPGAISTPHMVEWGRAFGVDFKPWELRALARLDTERLIHFSQQAEEQAAVNAGEAEPPVSGREFSLDLFDAVMGVSEP